MENQAFNRVCYNEYVMNHILILLSPKDQYNLQRVCRLLRDLVVACVWKRDWKEMRMYRDRADRLTDNEFLECLMLNADNVQKLSIDAIDGTGFELYFPRCYDNLAELRIERFVDFDVIDKHIIARNCPKLQLFSCNGGNVERSEVKISLEILWTLSNLRVVILRNLSTSCGELYLLGTKVPLERLELYNVGTPNDHWNSNQGSLDLPGLKVLIIDNKQIRYEACDAPLLKFVRNCPYLKELKLDEADLIPEGFFDELKHLETAKLQGCISFQTLWKIMTQNKLKQLETDAVSQFHQNWKFTEEIRANCSSLERLQINRPEERTIGSWLLLFESPLITFDNLQELKFDNPTLDDEFVQLIAVKCPQLRSLVLSHSRISGKFINHLQNITTLSIEGPAIPWSNIYFILRDLKMLQDFKMHFASLTRDEFAIPPNSKDFANSLRFLHINLRRTNREFWEYIFSHCVGSFMNVHTLHVRYFGQNFGALLVNFVKLQELRLECGTISSTSGMMIPTTKHVAFVNCMCLEWTVIANVLISSKVETLEMFDGSIKIDHASWLPRNGIQQLKQLRSATIPFALFRGTFLFWSKCMEECPEFRLCCICNSRVDQITVLGNICVNLPENYKSKIKPIHVSEPFYTYLDENNEDDIGDEESDGLCFQSIKEFCAASRILEKVPVCLLDEGNERLWSPRYGGKYVVVVEI